MKIFFLMLFALILVHIGLAQRMPVRTTINTPYGNVPHTYYVGTPMHHNYGSGMASVKYQFTIIMKDDSTFATNTKIEFDSSAHSITVRDGNKNKKIIYPSQTKGIVRVTADGKKLYGMAADSCWLFRSVSGRINAYAPVAETGMAYVVAIQRGDDGPIIPYTKWNLLTMIDSDQKAKDLILKKDNPMKAIEVFNKKDKAKEE